MAVTLVITFHPGTALVNLEEAQAKLSAFEQPLIAIGALMSNYMAINFAKAPWPPLKDSTLKRKARGSYPADPLVRTGEMIRAASGAEWSAGRKGRGEFEATLGVPSYSARHFEGTRFMEARDYGFIPDDAGQKAVDIVMEYLSSGTF